ncbi:hypothetical protein ACFOU2_16105 [Bacillus songklensis]|uniref:Uncharacterized protein n=1 Tax=Bacillus songklensis TaxID=1069116 RepID=A0ABV8B6U8_9BACI
MEESIRSLAHRNKVDLDTARAILAPYLANLKLYREQLDKQLKHL